MVLNYFPGTRTPTQVQSRVQKYFIALRKEGLPIPGRLPKDTQRYAKIHRGVSNAMKLT